MILQFDRPIPEREFFAVEYEDENSPEVLAQMAALWQEAGVPLHGWQPTTGDAVVALVMTQGEVDGVLHHQVVAFFASTALNRVHWQGQAELTWLAQSQRTFIENKRMLRNLAVACVAYLNCINLTLERQETPEKVQKRRAKEGKPPLPAYYTVVVAPAYRREGEGEGGGWKHGHLYDVRGHFRRLQDGRLIWVHPHQRGLAHATYVPGVRVVDSGLPKAAN